MSPTMREVLSRDSIQTRVRELAATISAAYGEEPVVAICVLKGAFLFFADLVRALRCPVQVEFVRLCSYGQGTESCGKVTLAQDLGCSLAGRHALIVEDIVDTGLSLQFLLENLAARGPATLRTCALVDKFERRSVDLSVDYAGFRVQEGFLVGYGLDYAEDYRTLETIYTLEFPK